MIICSGCGHANGQGDAFCGSCGGFLEWDGEPVAAVPAPRPALVEAVPAQHSVRVPQAEHERPAPVRPDPVDLGPADLYCGSCGAGSASGRSFCRRCGAPLADAAPDERVGWWRRLWQALRNRFGGRRTYAAGERPDGWAKLHDASASGGSRKRKWWRPRMPARLSLGKLALPLAILSLVGLRHRAHPGVRDGEGLRALQRDQPGGGAALRAGVGERCDVDQRAAQARRGDGDRPEHADLVGRGPGRARSR